MKTFVAWRILTHEKGRSGLATAGIFIAILLIFLQLGFYTSVPNGGMLVYDAMRFDLLIRPANISSRGGPASFRGGACIKPGRWQRSKTRCRFTRMRPAG